MPRTREPHPSSECSFPGREPSCTGLKPAEQAIASWAASSELDQVERRQRAAWKLLQIPANGQAAEVDDREAGLLQHFTDGRLGGGIVAGHEEHAMPIRDARILCQHRAQERVGGL